MNNMQKTITNPCPKRLPNFVESGKVYNSVQDKTWYILRNILYMIRMDFP